MTTNYHLAAAVTTLAVIAAVGFRTTVPDEAIYTSTTFAIPFEVTPPDWVEPGTPPTFERPHFVTWVLSDPGRAVRFFAPATVIQPPNATETEVPDDYVDYLLSLSEFGATFDDIVETTVDGNPATILTATTANNIDGSLGCEKDPTGQCWSLETDKTLHIAVIDTDYGTLLVWQRDPADSGPVDYSSFDAMLASLHFPEDVVPPTEPDPATTSPATSDLRLPEGLYRTPELTTDQLLATGVAAGFDEADVQANIDQDIDSTVTWAVQLHDGIWTLLMSRDRGPYEDGWEGTYEIIDDNTVSTYSPVDDCTITYTYSFEGEQLTLDNDTNTCFPGFLGVQIAQAIIYESAPFTLVVPPTEPAAETTSPEASDPRLPEGLYRTAELTVDQLVATGVAAGFDEADMRASMDDQGIDSTVTIGLQLADGIWTTLLSYDGEPYGSGSQNPYEVVDDDTVTASDPIGDCTITYTYAFDGEQLTLDMVDDPCSPGFLGEQLTQTWIYESAPFTLIDSGATTTAP